MRKFETGIASLSMLSAAALPAAASDLYVPPVGQSLKDAPVVESWTGFYAGVNGGYAWSNSHAQVVSTGRSYGSRRNGIGFVSIVMT
jgi:outer membrane immunogenic protein